MARPRVRLRTGAVNRTRPRSNGGCNPAFCHHSAFGPHTMSTIVIRNLPEHLHAQLKARAQRNHRSLNRETLVVLESALSRPAIPMLSPLLKLKGGYRPSIEDIEAAIAAHRD
ncbi:MAG: hypothetical protein C4338_00385 [Rhodanobacteraceae bacterium]